jgi:hypothetical protein
MIGFIDDHRGEYGVEPICAVLPIAPSVLSFAKTSSASFGEPSGSLTTGSKPGRMVRARRVDVRKASPPLGGVRRGSQ